MKGSGQGGVRFKEPTDNFFEEEIGVPGTGLEDSEGTPEDEEATPPSSFETCFRGEERNEEVEITVVEEEKFLSNASMERS
jgi:hypothetical protein